jgi:S-adenosylmethionine-diacylglycerol 3-amino-3-carboxypropyl transferase
MRGGLSLFRFFGFFDLIYRHNLIYNQCWEDPALDREALELSERDRVLVITSAGCNALDYALCGARVLAVDANPRQNHLLELKIAGIRRLDHESFFELFGSGGSQRLEAIYAELRPALAQPSLSFWDEKIRAVFDPRRSRGRSFYYCGTSGLFALAFCRYLESVGLAPSIHRILGASSVVEQRALYREWLHPKLFGARALVRVLASSGALALLGVPPPQRELIARHPGGVAGYLEQCLERVMGVCPLRENYFWSVYLTGRYAPEVCPRYLSREGFHALKEGLVDRIEVRTATVTSALERPGERLSAFVLLDHMDWLAKQPRLLEEEWRAIFARASGDARAIFRSGGPDAGFLPEPIRRRLLFDRERAERLHARDRVATYGSFHIARIPRAA